ncbi:hypothetical protein [Pseudaminobacter soli (ex Li et al. 2025)]|uniref:Uncharacterized protein n=1 Tax=Pseudaminobacter soli (ex Li et al. 2025) TaxID=1295366 RepID=A0A2P7S1D5_9HYPH|nr:hypothetical protein [Mesorhizobium soli]PSJ56294.1 hypothetical protein C7I85_25190 [Mesorhizobium soli]
MRAFNVAFALLIIIGAANAANNKLKFWNLTANTVTELYLAPAETQNWGENQTKNDPDGSVDHDERLTVRNTPPGLYDAKLTDKAGRTCTVKNIEVKDKGVFSIEEKQLTDCTK